jgi:hypothetical protein
MTTDRLTDQQLADIEARAGAATPGPWGVYQYGGDSLIEIAADLEETGHGYRARRGIARFDEEPLDNDPTHREWTAEEDWAQVQADAAYIAAMSPEVAKALLAEVRQLRAALTEIRHLHKDSPMGPCPLCVDTDAAAAGGDGLVPYPCPTARLAGAQDCDPPHVRAARYAAAGDEMAASLVRDGFGDDEIADMLGPGVADGEAPEPTQLRWGLDDVMWGDDDSTIVMLSGPQGEPYWLELDAERAAVLRSNLAGPDGEQPTADDEPEPSTSPCGHDDYHGAHEWADRPGVWCPGHSLDAAASAP